MSTSRPSGEVNQREAAAGEASCRLPGTLDISCGSSDCASPESVA